jgi:hypothetical protein
MDPDAKKIGDILSVKQLAPVQLVYWANAQSLCNIRVFSCCDHATTSFSQLLAPKYFLPASIQGIVRLQEFTLQQHSELSICQPLSNHPGKWIALPILLLHLFMISFVLDSGQLS